jgi:hypothetical protein
MGLPLVGDPATSSRLRFVQPLGYEVSPHARNTAVLSREGPMGNPLPVWALLRERTPTPYKGRVEPEKGTLAAVTRQPLIDMPSGLTYPATGRSRQTR